MRTVKIKQNIGGSNSFALATANDKKNGRFDNKIIFNITKVPPEISDAVVLDLCKKTTIATDSKTTVFNIDYNCLGEYNMINLLGYK